MLDNVCATALNTIIPNIAFILFSNIDRVSLISYPGGNAQLPISKKAIEVVRGRVEWVECCAVVEMAETDKPRDGT